LLKVYNNPEWWPVESWKGQTVVIVASGGSANRYDYSPYRGKAKFIVINDSYKLVPDADVLISSDGDWWNRYQGAPDFKGLKLTCDWSITQAYRDVHLISISKIHSYITVERPGYVGIGLNTGFYAINMAIQFGPPKRLILSGFDMNLINGVHWHGPHPKGSGNPNKDKLSRWRKIIDDQSHMLRETYHVDVINVCPTSSLKNYRKMTLSEAFNLEMSNG
jgi:hypothetical protein